MIFEAYVDDKLLYYPNDETFVITNDKLDLALNEAGTLEFDIPRDNLRYDEFNLRSSMIKVLQNDNEIFYGEVREVTENFDFTKHVYAVGELAFLFDSIQPQKRYQCSPLEMFREVIKIHNSQVEPRKRFEIGEVSVTDNNDYVYHYTNYEDTLTVLRDKLCGPLDGYLKITKANGVRYINLLPIERYGVFCSQEIQFGENLLEFASNTTTADIATALVPLGGMIEEADRTIRAVEGLDEYVTIVGTAADDYHKNVDDDYIVNEAAVKQFGYIKVVKEWNEVYTPETLKNKAIEWLKRAQFAELILEISAFDQNLIDVNIDSFNLGDTVSVWAVPFGMESVVFPVQKKTIYMSDLVKNRMTLGNSYTKSYTSQASDAVNALLDEIPQTSPILENAKSNSLRILEGTDGSHIIFKLDEKGKYIKELIICDNRTEEQSLHKWVWNLGGLGYLKRESVQNPWTDLGVAITMDGRIVADYLTTGKIALAGSEESPEDGVFMEIFNGDEKIGEWGSNGIKILKGEININDMFIVHNDGACETRNGLLYKNDNMYIDMGTTFPDMFHFFTNACKVKIDSAGRFCLDRLVIAEGADEDSGTKIQFDKNGISYNGKLISWSKLTNL